MHSGKTYDGKSCDLFAAGIILFLMVAAHPPFASAQPQDPFYKLLAQNKTDIFWQTHLKNKKHGFSNDFKDLINRLLALNPLERMSMAQLTAHPWMQSKSATKKQVMSYLRGEEAGSENKFHDSFENASGLDNRAVIHMTQEERLILNKSIESINHNTLMEADMPEITRGPSICIED